MKKSMIMNSLALSLIACLAPLGCGEKEGSELNAVGESNAWYQQRVTTTGAAPIAMQSADSPNFLDVRGVGDSGVDLTNLANIPAYWAADLSFMNFESVVAESCSQRNPGVDFYFRSSKEEVRKAHRAGFNLFSVANNHARDCFTPYGPSATEASMEELMSELPILWHGTAADNPYEARVASFEIKGREVKVAMAAVTIQNWSMEGTAQIVLGRGENANKPEIKQLLSSLQQADADFRILSIHTQDSSNSRYEGPAVKTLKSLAQTFITSYNGNLVFGHGPHTQAGVKVVERNDGRRGVVFTSLGNFLHPTLAAHGDNYLGRAVFDLENGMNLKAVQSFPLSNVASPSIRFNRPNVAPKSNFDWQKGNSSFYASF